MSDITFNEEKDFEEAVIKALIEHGWESDVIRYPSEEDLIQNWANILFHYNIYIHLKTLILRCFSLSIF